MNELLTTLREESFYAIEKASSSVNRDIRFPQTDGLVKVAIGMRRAGKTYSLFQVINALIRRGIPKEQILFIDFEDDRLLPMSMKEMGELLDSFYTIYPENHTKKCYFFLDEVQNIDGWHQVIRRYLKSKDVEITITGSSAKLLSKEINTSLRGRALAIEIMPYDFNEFRSAHNIAIPKPPFSRQAYDIANKQLKNFFAIGGFPAVQNMEPHDWRAILQSYIDTVILRDIIERHGISNAALLKYLIKTLIINAATVFSVNKFYNDIKSQGYKVSRETIYNYLNYIEDAFLIFRVPLYSESARLQQTSSNKIYVIDNGLINASSLKIKDLYNKYLENQVHLDLRRHDTLISNPIIGKSWEGFVVENIHSVLPRLAASYFYRTAAGAEIDLVIKMPNAEVWAIEIKYGIAPKIGKHYSQTCDDIGATHKFLVYGGDEQFPVGDNILVISLPKIMEKIISSQ